MPTDGGHLEFPIDTKNISFVEFHPMSIHAMFAWIGLLVSEESFLTFYVGSHVKTTSADGGHLKFPIDTKLITL